MSECAATSIIQRRVRAVRICTPHSLINHVNRIRCVNGRVASVVADVANREERLLKVGEDVDAACVGWERGNVELSDV